VRDQRLVDLAADDQRARLEQPVANGLGHRRGVAVRGLGRLLLGSLLPFFFL